MKNESPFCALIVSSLISRHLLFDVFLVVFFGAVKVGRHFDRYKFPLTALALASQLGQLLLVFGMTENGRAILRAITRRIVGIKELIDHLFVRQLVGVKGDPNGFGIVLNIAISRIL